MDSATKVCNKCGECKLVKDFSKRKAGRLGVTAVCRLCHSAYLKALRVNNHSFRNQAIENARKWKAENPEAVKRHRIADCQKRRLKIKAKRDNLSDSYVAMLVARGRCFIGDVPPDLLALKREQLEIHRLSKEIKSQIKEAIK